MQTTTLPVQENNLKSNGIEITKETHNVSIGNQPGDYHFIFTKKNETTEITMAKKDNPTFTYMCVLKQTILTKKQCTFILRNFDNDAFYKETEDQYVQETLLADLIFQKTEISEEMKTNLLVENVTQLQKVVKVQTEKIELLEKKIQQLESQKRMKNNPLFALIQKRNEELLKQKLDQNNINHSCKYESKAMGLIFLQMTPLHLCCYLGNRASLVNILLEKGSKPGSITEVINFNESTIINNQVILWTEKKIPEGWIICDGQNGTPDLSGRFFMGSGTQNFGSKGGEEKVTLTINELPSHSHTLVDPGHNHKLPRGDKRWNSGSGNTFWGGNTNGSIQSSKTGISIQKTGNNKSHNNLPPYFVGHYIMKSKRTQSKSQFLTPLDLAIQFGNTEEATIIRKWSKSEF
ncbi:sowah [Anaeramoeba flamelloides]|uniref:Sowah n=1 Tax=Anaeramoeba flamelloides TaxID=1746091 RepID=A0ABQ8Y5S3_9EUKA|nr:sowah [Anaeramoeba flamelloides]